MGLAINWPYYTNVISLSTILVDIKTHILLSKLINKQKPQCLKCLRLHSSIKSHIMQIIGGMHIDPQYLVGVCNILVILFDSIEVYALIPLFIFLWSFFVCYWQLKCLIILLCWTLFRLLVIGNSYYIIIQSLLHGIHGMWLLREHVFITFLICFFNIM